MWFNIGLKTKDTAKKIEAYREAVAYDPEFTEALYNLGLAYRANNSWPEAERYLLEALQSRQGDYNMQLKVAILYEIAQIYKSTGRFAECEETLRGALGLASDPTIRNAMYLELSRVLLQMQRYEDALVELEKARLLPGADVQTIPRWCSLRKPRKKA